MSKASHERITGRLHVKKRYVIILFGLVFAVGTGWIVSRKFHERQPKLISKKEALHRKSDRLPEKKGAVPINKDLPRKPVPFPEKKTAATDRVQKRITSKRNINKFKPIGEAAKTAPLSAYKSQKHNAVSLNKNTSSSKPVRKETAVEKPDEKSSPKIVPDRFASFPVKRSNQTKIDIQAIAWSNDPKSRLAVINGFVLRERESIDNAIVMHIGKDSVIFKRQGEEWKQMFGY
jgi:hypothetical protein